MSGICRISYLVPITVISRITFYLVYSRIPRTYSRYTYTSINAYAPSSYIPYLNMSPTSKRLTRRQQRIQEAEAEEAGTVEEDEDAVKLLAYKFPAPFSYTPSRNKRTFERLWSFMEQKKIIIKPADKNLGLTVMDRAWYMDQIKFHVSNESNYKRIKTSLC